jgi:hypothetical protein
LEKVTETAMGKATGMAKLVLVVPQFVSNHYEVKEPNK